MEVLTHFDSGVATPYETGKKEITLDLRGEKNIFNVLVAGAPAGLKITVLMTGNTIRNFAAQ